QNKVCICQREFLWDQLCLCFSTFRYGSEFFSLYALYLGIKMSYDTIILNCLIIPIGKLMNISGIKVMQAIVVRKHEGARDIEAEIQSRLGAPFNKIGRASCRDSD